MGYKIGSFNCLNFGMGSSKDIQVFADIITQERFDIVALQEIKGENALKRILSRLGSAWDGKAEDRVNDYAFIWNKNRIALAASEKNGVYKPRIYQQYRIDKSEGQKELVREPFFARFVPVGFAAPYIEIRIINTHIRYSKGNDEEDEQSLGAVKMRKNEFDVLTKAIYSKEADKRYGNNRPAYTILLGDYNLNHIASGAGSPYLIESFEIGDDRDKKIIVTSQTELTTLKAKKDDDDSENDFANNYDHFTYDAKRFQSVSVQCHSVNAVKEYCSNDFEKYRKDVSDHIPVVMDLNINR